MEALLAKQTKKVRSITRTIENFRKIGKDNVTLAVVQNRQKILEENWNAVQVVDAELDATVDAEMKTKVNYFTDDIYSAAETSYYTASDYLATKAAEFTEEPAPALDVSVTAGEGSVQTRLPTIELPRFGGTYSEWYKFRDLFKSIVERNKSLRDVQRLHYLNSCLDDEAKDLIAALELTDANYKVAWDLLDKRYDNRRVIVLEHLTTVLNIPVSTQGTAAELKKLRDTVARAVNSLEALKRPVKHWDDLLLAIVLNKLDSKTRRCWELDQKSTTEIPAYSLLDAFLGEQIRALDAFTQAPNQNKASSSKPNSHNKQGNSKTVRSHATVSNTQTKCSFCPGEHSLTQCSKFKGQPIEQRLASVRQIKCCFNCLKRGHLPAACPSDRRCFICSRKHNTLLHCEQKALLESVTTEQSSEQRPSTNDQTISVNSHHTLESNSCKRRSILLATAVVILHANDGRSVPVRALLDQGSDSSFVTESVVQLLRAQRRKISASVEAVGGTPVDSVRSYVSLALSPKTDSRTMINFDALIYEKITSYQTTTGELNQYAHLQNLQMADPNPSSHDRIDLLIGADIYGSILRPGLVQGTTDSPTAQKTIFGWVIFGPTQPRQRPRSSISVHHINSLVNLNGDLRCFWETEEPPSSKIYSEEDLRCQEHFHHTHSRAPNGKYVVRLPFKNTPPKIGNSFRSASRCFTSLEKRLANNPEVAALYKDFMHVYEDLGHMTRAPDDEDSSNTYYLPHHPVIRDDSATTRLRVVFNASSVTSNGSSLNSQVLIGPRLQPDLLAITIAWRMDRVVFTADIEKMYRQIWLDPRDQSYQRIIWRSNPAEPATVYQLRTVTYGMACAPFLAIRVLAQLADDGKRQYPRAAEILSNRFYVDDALFGADNETEAVELKKELNALLDSGGFRLRKWASNAPHLLDKAVDANHEFAIDDSKDKDASVKVLGLRWMPLSDSFQFQVRLSLSTTTTKRSILSVIARLYDPFGWLSPVIITAKILIQELWLRQLDWDEPVPDELKTQWVSYCTELSLLSNLSIPRWTGSISRVSAYELHGFADASSRAYAAVVYLRVTNPDNEVRITLLLAKSKVAPLKQLTIPKLELCAATLLSRLLQTVQEILRLESLEIHAWTDSSIVLDWISAHPSRWPTFIANRVVEIHNRVPTARWHHIRSAENPADSASRGINPSELISHPLWWGGPPIDLSNHQTWKTIDADLPEQDHEQPIAIRAQLTQVDDQAINLVNTVSSWPKILRITAYILRFIAHSRRTETHASRALTGSELLNARRFWIIKSQREDFPEEIKALKSKTAISQRSPLYRLSPSLDSDGVLRLGGRLRRSHLTHDAKHPIILAHDQISQLIIEQAHLRALHGGAQLTLASLRQNFWIIGARAHVRRSIDHCVPCARNRVSLATQKMGDLPEARSIPSRPFSHVGVDYAGPVLVRTAKRRGYKSYKAYIALFVCLSVRAVHLELVDGYSSSAFLAAFHRFTSRRGTPNIIYSDNGTTFRGAEKEMRLAIQLVENDVELKNTIVTEGVTWQFIPPSAPHFGGLWEAGVKVTKYHLKRVLGTHTLTFEEYTTLLTRIEACLNSRPLGPMTSDPDDLAPLTPGHFLIGGPINAVLEPSVLDLNENRLSRWQLVQRLTEQFWRRWATEYLHTLQQRNKWATAQQNLQINDLVLIKNDNLPPTRWLLGRVINTYAGHDGLTRVVKLKTATSVFKRPIHQLCKLPVETVSKESGI